MKIINPFPVRIRKRVVPAILAHSKKEFLSKLHIIKKEYPQQRFQIDVLNGTFVPYRAWARTNDIGKMRLKNFDVHLMTTHPERQLEKWRTCGADRIFFHHESTARHREIIDKIHALHMKAGIALNPETKINNIRLLLPLLDAILLMGEHPGYGGQPFRKTILTKIKMMRKIAPRLPIIIDGGVTRASAPLLLKAGASELASGHAALSPFEKNI